MCSTYRQEKAECGQEPTGVWHSLLIILCAALLRQRRALWAIPSRHPYSFRRRPLPASATIRTFTALRHAIPDVCILFCHLHIPNTLQRFASLWCSDRPCLGRGDLHTTLRGGLKIVIIYEQHRTTCIPIIFQKDPHGFHSVDP